MTHRHAYFQARCPSPSQNQWAPLNTYQSMSFSSRNIPGGGVSNRQYHHNKSRYVKDNFLNSHFIQNAQSFYEQSIPNPQNSTIQKNQSLSKIDIDELLNFKAMINYHNQKTIQQAKIIHVKTKYINKLKEIIDEKEQKVKYHKQKYEKNRSYYVRNQTKSQQKKRRYNQKIKNEMNFFSKSIYQFRKEQKNHHNRRYSFSRSQSSYSTIRKKRQTRPSVNIYFPNNYGYPQNIPQYSNPSFTHYPAPFQNQIPFYSAQQVPNSMPIPNMRPNRLNISSQIWQKVYPDPHKPKELNISSQILQKVYPDPPIPRPMINQSFIQSSKASKSSKSSNKNGNSSFYKSDKESSLYSQEQVKQIIKKVQNQRSNDKSTKNIKESNINIFFKSSTSEVELPQTLLGESNIPNNNRRQNINQQVKQEDEKMKQIDEIRSSNDNSNITQKIQEQNDTRQVQKSLQICQKKVNAEKEGDSTKVIRNSKIKIQYKSSISQSDLPESLSDVSNIPNPKAKKDISQQIKQEHQKIEQIDQMGSLFQNSNFTQKIEEQDDSRPIQRSQQRSQNKNNVLQKSNGSRQNYQQAKKDNQTLAFLQLRGSLQSLIQQQKQPEDLYIITSSLHSNQHQNIDQFQINIDTIQLCPISKQSKKLQQSLRSIELTSNTNNSKNEKKKKLLRSLSVNQ